MTGKYEALSDYLKARPAEMRLIDLSFGEVEKIIGAPLPQSAYTHREWWSNQSDTSNRPQARAWINAGFLVDAVQQARTTGRVCFRRR